MDITQYNGLIEALRANSHPTELPEVVETCLALPADLAGAALADSVEHVLNVRARAKGYCDDVDAQIKELQAMRRPHARLLAVAEAEVLEAVKRHKGPLAAGPWKASLRTAEAVVCDEAALLPEEFRREKTTVEPDKAAIKAALKAGENVPGAALETTYSLQVK